MGGPSEAKYYGQTSKEALGPVIRVTHELDGFVTEETDG